ncbi:MAG: hypothetical protein D4S02_05865 [Rhodocyclaceae bacterium]|nr:MAG: hypothetical protein D4S02_05865 [Rhodocyclaceae bacterium]
MSAVEMNFGLPPMTAERMPDFIDESSCREWLAGLPVTNLNVSRTRLMRQLNLLNRYSLRADERLKILELLRNPVNFIQDQGQKRFAGRPLPFNAVEQAAFDASQALWQELVTGYLHCLRADPEGAAAAPHLLASVAATRALAAMLAIHLDACHANILTAPTFWRQLHSIYHAAEELKLTQLPIEVGLRCKRTAASAYIEVLLMAAAFPHELRSKQLSLVAGWAQRWSGKVTIQQRPPADQRTPALCVDLSSDQTAGYEHPSAKNDAPRWLELSQLRKSIKKRLVLLAQGESPEALRLGKGCEPPACEALLKRIYQCWCKGGVKEHCSKLRSGQRVKSSCQLVSGFDSIHYHLSGQMSLEQNRSVYLGHHQHEEIATFGRITTHVDDGNSESPGLLLEEWRIVDQSAADLHLERPLSPPGKPLVGDQLVAVRLHDGEGFILGKVCWIAMSASRDGLIARISLLPGRPEGITIRRSGPGSSNAQSSRGLFLPEIGQLGETASMLIPPRWFASNRIIGVEVPAKDLHQIRLNHLVERGVDFERVTFEWV